MASTGPALIRRSRAGHGARLISVAVTVACLAIAAVGIALRNPAPPPARIVLLQTTPGAPVVERSAPADLGVPRRMGDWTPAIGETIARRALRWLSWPYSFGAGDATGPTFGHAVDEDSRNDGEIRGFDCSGLTLYALAPWRQLTHFAATQYQQAGSYHPTLAELLPGDLIFWSLDGTVRGIGHVAIYLGEGKVVQAPHSGARITITPLNQVERGDMGATRPLS